jgi:hypothetical protein
VIRDDRDPPAASACTASIDDVDAAAVACRDDVGTGHVCTSGHDAIAIGADGHRWVARCDAVPAEAGRAGFDVGVGGPPWGDIDDDEGVESGGATADVVAGAAGASRPARHR